VKRTRLSAAELKAQVAARAGCVKLAYSRHGAGPLVGVYKSLEAGMEDDPSTPWSVVCEEHGAIVGTRTRADAVLVSGNTDFCDDCREDKASS
jgi:hypothetical protein